MGEIEGKDETDRERFWCGECGLANFPDEGSAPDNALCPGCGSEMKALGNLSKTERSSFAFQEWMDGLHKKRLWGPSPGGAASRLPGVRAISWLELGRRTVSPGPGLAKLPSFQANHSLKARLLFGWDGTWRCRRPLEPPGYERGRGI
jgi:hypothetical protein